MGEIAWLMAVVELMCMLLFVTPDAEKFDGLENDYECEFVVDYVKIYQK